MVSKDEEISIDEYRRLKDNHAAKIESEALRKTFKENVIKWASVSSLKCRLKIHIPE